MSDSPEIRAAVERAEAAEKRAAEIEKRAIQRERDAEERSVRAQIDAKRKGGFNVPTDIESDIVDGYFTKPEEKRAAFLERQLALLTDNRATVDGHTRRAAEADLPAEDEAAKIAAEVERRYAVTDPKEKRYLQQLAREARKGADAGDWENDEIGLRSYIEPNFREYREVESRKAFSDIA